VSAYQAVVKKDGYVETLAFPSVAAHADLEAADDAEDVGAGVEEFVGAWDTTGYHTESCRADHTSGKTSY
jgi:hypothetical protein